VALGEEGVPFAPVIEALRGLAHHLDAAELEAVAGPARADLARLLPDLAWSGEATADAAVVGAGQGRLFALLLGVVERLAERAPLLWVMEDLHWADRSTRDLVAFVGAYLRSGRVLLTRVVRLGDRTQQLLRVAAAAGPGVTQPVLAAVAGMDDAALLEDLREAVDQQVLLPSWLAPGTCSATR
jgi:predicted ATPase